MMTSSEILLQQITKEISLYMPIVLLIFGTCGCLCNFITFTSKELKNSSCAFYFFCIAIIELCTFYFGLISRLANDRLGSTLFSTNLIYCKIRSYLIVTLPLLITYMILLTSIDRYMSTRDEARYRAFSQLKIAYRAAPLTILLTMILFSHMLIFYDFYPACTAQPGLYSLIYSIYLVIWTGFIPNGLTLLFSFLTIRNAIRAKRRIIPTVTQQQQNVQRRESQLLAMMFGQAILSSSLDFMRIALYAYFVLSTNMPKSSYQRTVDVLLLQISIFLLYTNCSKSFYSYTLFSGFFRQIFRQSLGRYYRKLRVAFHLEQNSHPQATHTIQTTKMQRELKIIPQPITGQ